MSILRSVSACRRNQVFPSSSSLFLRFFSTSDFSSAENKDTDTYHAIVRDTYGPAEHVLRLVPQKRPSSRDLGPTQILLKILAAPMNPSDISCIEGRYPLRPDFFPCSPGFEGVGVVEAVGSEVTRFKSGDLAIPIEHGQGTWRTFGCFEQNHWYRIPSDIPLSTAATMCINPPTALRLLEEFIDLQAGDALVHTGGNSSTGKYILQLAKERGIHSISVIRDRPAAERHAVEEELKAFGSSLVLTADQLTDVVLDRNKSGIWKHGLPKLALDCVGGPSSLEVAKVLDKDGVLVVYGGMSRQPVQIPPGALIFNNISVHGFWLTGGYAQMKDGWKAKELLVDRVIALFRQGILKPARVHCMPLTDWREGLEMYRKSNMTKVLLTNYEEDVCL
jgi:trans-2-enoyl-CoA reductase